MKILGVLSLVFFAVHAGVHWHRGQPENALWACHVGAVLTGIGLIVSSPATNAVGAFWLSLGLPLWIFDLAMGLQFLPTSTLTHVGSLVIGYVGMRRLGLPRGVWWKAAAGGIALCGLSRMVTPPQENVNISHRVYDGWAHIFPSHALYLLGFFASFTILFVLLQWILPKVGFRKPA